MFNSIRSISSSLHLRSHIISRAPRHPTHWQRIPQRRTYSSFSDSRSSFRQNQAQITGDAKIKARVTANDATRRRISSERTIDSHNATQSALTHVNDKGEAHMVDVGSKEASRRVAIATACVSFSNATPHAQIVSNTNKKGDVLGVARIAGIMAAKRTSDLIPLCHPIMITKVNVNADLILPGHDLHPHGAVSLEARVECVGQTGVEMEALTASTAAALTIYDMCKAVDRDMAINQAKVVFKNGGKSGIHMCKQWTETKDDAFMKQLLQGVPEK